MTAYATTAQLQIRIQMFSVPTAAQLAMLQELLDAASRSIDRVCRKPDDAYAAAPAASAMYFAAEGKKYLRVPPFVSVTEVAAKADLSAIVYTAWTTESSFMAGDGDWFSASGDPNNPTFSAAGDLIIVNQNGTYSTFLESDGAPVVRVTAQWGALSGVPADIREATLMQAAIWFKQFQGSMSSELGTYDLGTIVYSRGLSSAVKELLVEGCWVLPLYGGA